MTRSENPQGSDSHQQGDPQAPSTATQAANSSGTATSTKAAAGNGETGSAGGSSAAHTGGQDTDAQASGEAGVDTPPWQRVSGDDSVSGSSPGNVDPGNEDTESIPHPLRNTALNAGAASVTDVGGEQASEYRGGRTTVSFAGPREAGAAAAGSATSGAASSTARRPSRGPRRASLQVKRVDPWSVLKLALVLSVAAFFVWMIAVAVLYGVLGGMGVWDQLNGTFSELTQPENSLGEPLITVRTVFAYASILGAVNIVLITALATVGAFIYNAAADFAGGIEVTLSERE